MNQFIIEYLTFNKREMRGIFVLTTILFCLVIANLVIPAETDEEPVEFREYEKEIIAFEKEMKRLDSLETKPGRKKHISQSPSSAYSGDLSSSRHFFPENTLRIELNSADTFDLQRLRGIGSSFAKRIVKYRDRLGGFIEKRQLMEIFGMDSSRYNGIAEHILVNRDSVRRLCINAVSFKDLMKHPYFPFEVTKVIMIYKKEHKRINSAEVLRSIPGIHDTVYRKILPYLRFD